MSDVLRQLRQQQATAGARPRLLERFASFLPTGDATPLISLGEGFTPLIPARTLGRAIGCPLLHLKVEMQNPTGSFKDRGMVLAVARALEEGSRALICVSTGSTAASAAAYGAHTGMEVLVVAPQTRVAAAGGLLRAQAAGARVVAVDGGWADALDAVSELVAAADLAPRVAQVDSVNPLRTEGQKTAAFEVCEDLGGAPDYLAVPLDDGANMAAHWQGFGEYRAASLVETVPVMLGVQTDHFGHEGQPSSSERAERARSDSGGRIDVVTREEIRAAYRDIVRYEGLFCDPASAASVAGVRRLASEGAIDPGATIVCVLTGHGLKDPETARSELLVPHVQAAPTATGIRRAVGW